jgi:hypothetical protein
VWASDVAGDAAVLPSRPPVYPVLDALLPSLLHVKAVAILDHALRAWLPAHGLRKGPDRHDRIALLVAPLPLRAEEAEALYTLKDLRNAVAHNPQGTRSWDALDYEVVRLHGTLRRLPQVGDLPQLSAVYQQSKMRGGEEPGGAFCCDQTIMMKEGDPPGHWITWQQRWYSNEEA